MAGVESLSNIIGLGLSVAFMFIFAIMAIFMLLMMWRAFKVPRAYYPPPAYEIVKQLMCPKCGSKDLELVGYYTIRCKKCAFMYSIGRERVYYYPGIWLWPMVWWPFFWVWPLRIRKDAGRMME